MATGLAERRAWKVSEIEGEGRTGCKAELQSPSRKKYLLR
jgi:hypothetical protein